MKKAAITAYLVVLHLAVVYLIGEKVIQQYFNLPDFRADAVPDPTEAKESTGSSPVPSVSSTATVPVPTPSPIQLASTSSGLVVPVQGVRAEQLVDSFADTRSGARGHDAIDIAAPAGTPVIAAADGEIIKFFDSEAGGITIYQLSVDRKFVYYYAHLQKRADDLRVGDNVKQGRTIGLVGDTGNAGAGNFHLHFSIAAVTDPKRYWEGTYVNPYSLLKN